MEYSQIEKLPAESYLNPELFRTEWDTLPANTGKGYSDQQYQTGLLVGRESEYVTISARGTWGAVGKRGSVTTSYEGIGYHACTADLLRGFLDSGVSIIVYRYTNLEGVKIK